MKRGDHLVKPVALGQAKCEKCKAQWVPRVEKPLRCPRCHVRL